MFDISRYKLVYNDKVWKPIAIISFNPKPPFDRFDSSVDAGPIAEMDYLEVMVLNEDGNIITISDEGWKFQFIQIVGGK